MNDLNKKLKNAAEERYSLSSDERARMKDHVGRYMKIKPIRRRESIHYAFSSFYIAMRRTGAVVAVFAVVFVMGGLSAAANSALPGDVLYPIKHILEDARSTFSFSDESKAEWEVRRLERRIDEAALLEGMGELDVAKKARLEEHIVAHAVRVDELAAKVEGSNGIAAMNLRTNVAIELDSKGEIEVPQEESLPSIAALSVQDDAAARSMDAPETMSIMQEAVPLEEDTSEYKEAAIKQQDAVHELMSRIERQKGLVKIGLDSLDFESRVLTPLASLRGDVEKAKGLYKDGAYQEAHDLFVKIHKKARELDLILKRGSWRGVSVEAGEENLGSEGGGSISVEAEEIIDAEVEIIEESPDEVGELLEEGGVIE